MDKNKIDYSDIVYPYESNEVMVDITKCSGLNCPMKEKCYRYVAKEGMWQSYFMSPPFDGTGCSSFYFMHSMTVNIDIKVPENKPIK